MEHTVRMVVIPEEVYLSLANQNKKIMNPLDSYLLESSNRLNKILHDTSLDDTTKFKQYTEELKRIQKIKTNKDEMPMNVNIKNVDSTTLEHLSNAISEKIPHKVKEEEEEDQNSTYVTVESGDEDQPQLTPKKSPKAEKKANFEKLLNYLNDNRQKFGIREDGRLFKDASKKTVYAYSNIEKISRALTGLSPSRPHGMKTLFQAIKNDEYAKNLLTFDDSPRKSPQKGGGKPKKVIVKKGDRFKRPISSKCPIKKLNTTARYCPEIWS